jgi:hypothetical protein
MTGSRIGSGNRLDDKKSSSRRVIKNRLLPYLQKKIRQMHVYFTGLRHVGPSGSLQLASRGTFIPTAAPGAGQTKAMTTPISKERGSRCCNDFALIQLHVDLQQLSFTDSIGVVSRTIVPAATRCL